MQSPWYQSQVRLRTRLLCPMWTDAYIGPTDIHCIRQYRSHQTSRARRRTHPRSGTNNPPSAETSQLQAASLQQNDHAINAIRRSAYKSSKSPTRDNKQTRFAPDKKSHGQTSAPCRYCGGPQRHGTT
jgi:hypothetical protein